MIIMNLEIKISLRKGNGENGVKMVVVLVTLTVFDA